MNILDFNKGVARFEFDGGKDFDYVKLEDLYIENGKNEVYRVNALYINDSKFGEQPLAVTDTHNVNLPMHLLEDVKQIRNIEKIVDDINNGKVGFKIYQYANTKYNSVGYSMNWVEIDG